MSHLQKAQTGNKLLLARGSRALSDLTRGRRRPPSAEFSPERQLCPEAARPARVLRLGHGLSLLFPEPKSVSFHLVFGKRTSARSH